MRMTYVVLFAAAAAIPAHAAMTRNEALKHCGTASAAEPYCRNINSGDTIKVLDALSVDIGVDYENPTMIKARRTDQEVQCRQRDFAESPGRRVQEDLREVRLQRHCDQGFLHRSGLMGGLRSS
jgi:hypothetical protein